MECLLRGGLAPPTLGSIYPNEGLVVTRRQVEEATFSYTIGSFDNHFIRSDVKQLDTALTIVAPKKVFVSSKSFKSEIGLVSRRFRSTSDESMTAGPFFMAALGQ